MSFRKTFNRHDGWRVVVRENCDLLREVPTAALANEYAFRDYVTRGTHRDAILTPSVFELSRKAIDDLWTFINCKAQFDMDAILFDHFNEAYRRHHPYPK